MDNQPKPVQPADGIARQLNVGFIGRWNETGIGGTFKPLGLIIHNQYGRTCKVRRARFGDGDGNRQPDLRRYRQ